MELSGIKANYENLEILILNLRPKIICLQETFLKPSDFLNIPNYSSIHNMINNPRKASGGTSIFVRNDIPFSNLNINSKFQNTCCSISISKTITFCNLYL
ncbi:endonuclease/exonuclease/phosphatase family protein, partial [Salmonella sp. s55004]|uniref:endonuclease/exonuclease/phosphatase family protein n=1 Tax=Salmonella sp. s55004 TaxID=3159675 RepID=UPI00398111DC